MDKPELVVVMPVFNEQANIAAVLVEWLQTLRALQVSFEFLVVNDGSTDGTLDLLREARAHAPEVQEIDKTNSGHGRTCRLGYETALQRNAPWIFQIDSDGQCDPKFFPSFWNTRQNADCIFGDRRSRDDGRLRTFISFCCRIALWLFSGSYVHDPNVPYRLMRAEVLHTALQRIPAGLDLQNVLLALALKKDPSIRWDIIPIHFRARRAGHSTVNVLRLLKMGWEMLTDVKRVR